MEYSIAIPIFVFVLYGMIFLVQKFLEKVDPSIEEIDKSRVIHQYRQRTTEKTEFRTSRIS